MGAVIILIIEKGDLGIYSFLERGMADRFDIWMVTIKRLLQAPLLGEGYFTDISIDIGRSLETSPHNLLLLVMLKSGAIGGGIFLVLIVTVLVHSYRYFVASGNWIFLCILAFFLACMTVDAIHLLHKPSLGWLIFWMPVGLLAGEEIRRKSQSAY
jgi:O-antigen ligase